MAALHVLEVDVTSGSRGSAIAKIVRNESEVRRSAVEIVAESIPLVHVHPEDSRNQEMCLGKGYGNLDSSVAQWPLRLLLE